MADILRGGVARRWPDSRADPAIVSDERAGWKPFARTDMWNGDTIRRIAAITLKIC
jgi:hypothetical protein